MIHKYGIGLAFTIAAILVVVGLQGLGVFDLISLKLLDYSFMIRGPISGWAAREPRPNDSLDVVLIDVDDETYRLLGEIGWPYPREKIWARAVRNLVDAEAKVIIFDIQFDSRDAYSAHMTSYFGNNPPEGFIDGDLALAEAISYGREHGCEVIMSSTIKPEPNSIPPQVLVLPNRYIMTSQPDHGLIDMSDDVDNFIRRYPVFGRMEHEKDVWRPQLGIKALKYYLDIPDTVMLRYDRDSYEFVYGDLRIPSYGRFRATFLTNVYGPASDARIGDAEAWGTFKHIPLAWIIDTEDFELPIAEEDTDWMSTFDSTSGFNLMMSMVDPSYEVPESPFKDKICMIGVSVEVIHDYKSTSFYNYLGQPTLMPGFEYHANAIQTMLDDNYPRVWGRTLEFSQDSAWHQILLISVATLLAYVLLVIFQPLWGGILILLEALFMLCLGVGLFTADFFWLFKLLLGNRESIGVPALGGSVVIPIIPPMVGMALVYVANVLYQFILEQRDKYFLKNTFGTYISPELIDKMYEEKQEPKLGGDEGHHTAFFTDIQSFSSFSEQLSASEVVELLNEYLTDMTTILLDNQGTLDKYIGDAIVAFYGAPVPVERHEYLACLTAIQMQERLAELRAKWQAEGGKWPEIVHHMQNRIGIATGSMVTGNMGSAMRMNYTMMGDIVNTAARLESSAKQYGIYIQVAEETYQATQDEFEWRDLDFVKVKGKTLPVRVYECISRKGQLPGNYAAILPAYHEALKLYRAQQWDQAREAFIEADKLEDMFPYRPANPSRIYIPRCEQFKANPPGDNWDGSFTLTSK